jgi:hypothetical protein
MWLVVGILVLVAWAVAFLVFKIAGWAIHLLVLAAIGAAAVHIVQWVRSKRLSS